MKNSFLYFISLLQINQFLFVVNLISMRKKLISKKKPFYPINELLKKYLISNNRWFEINILYNDLLRFIGSVVVYDKNNNDTLWVRLFYNENENIEIEQYLKMIYARLHSDGNDDQFEFLKIDAIDYCTFGNSKPFRIKIRNILNDNFIYFYIKRTDASRVYGLEFEHMLSPYNINFLVNDSILIEEHISGIPGDIFIKENLNDCSNIEKAQLAKEYVKFNERCMIRLLGDMRSYNYVVVPIHDFDKVVYRVRPIDFDQQCFEGKFKIYRPQFFEENLKLMNLIRDKLNHDSVLQYKIEERSIIAKRIIGSEKRLSKIIDIMKKDKVTTKENLIQLRKEIFNFTSDESFQKSRSMGSIMESSFNYVRNHYENLNLSKLIRDYNQ
tara:strand:- start:69148 stop:70299 length:1152 start_codon:yes stop_codon:yes gene_type:complete